MKINLSIIDDQKVAFKIARNLNDTTSGIAKKRYFCPRIARIFTNQNKHGEFLFVNIRG